MSTNGEIKFVLERLKFPGTIVLDEKESNYCCGRGKENKIDCPSLAVSRKHCTFFRTGNELFVMDLKSSNGLFINGKQQKSHMMIKLSDNDHIGIGCRDIEDKEIDIKEDDRFIYKLHIIVENGETSSPPSNEKEDAGPVESKSKPNAKAGASRKRIQKVKEHEVPKKVAKLQNDTPKKAVGLSSGKASTSNAQNHDDIEIIHVSLNEDRLIQNGSDLGNSPAESATFISTNSSERVPTETKKSSPTTQCRKNVGNLGKAMEEIPENSIHVAKAAKEERISLDEITSKENNTFMLNGSIRTQMPQHKANNKTGQTPSTIIQEHPNETISVKKASEPNKRVKKASKPKSEESRKSNCNATLNEWICSDSTRRTNQFLMPEVKDVYGTSLIKYEEELQITDNEEDANLQHSREEIVAPSPIKIKQIKQEPKTRFSEVDIVNISDDEDDVFPCSQLFDTNFGTDLSFKQEFKEESNDNENSRFERPDDNEDIILSLSDSEDEANPWLDKLSRSQSEDLVSEKMLIKEEVMLVENETPADVDEPNQTTRAGRSRLSFVAQKLPNENELYKPGIDRHENAVRVIADAKVNSSFGVSFEKILEKPVTDDELRTKFLQTEESIVTSPTGASAIDDYEFISPSKLEKSVPVQTKSKIGKKIPEIEPLPLSSKKRRSLEGVKAKETAPKPIASKLSTKEKKEQKIKERRDEYLYKKEQKQRKQLNKWAECLPPSGKKKALDLSKEEKRTLSDHRKAKLKEIAEKRLSIENKQEKKRSVIKPKTKVTLKNRGDLLLNDQLNLDSSKRSLNESAEKASDVANNTHELPLTTQTSSNATAAKKGKSKNVPKQAVNKPSMDFESYLKLCEVPTKIKIPKKSSFRKEDPEQITDKAKSLVIAAENSVKPSPTSKEEKSDSKDKSAAGSNSTGKKRVRFAKELRTVCEFEIDAGNSMRKFTGKDAPIPLEKLPAKVAYAKSCPKLEDFLFRIFSWKPVWLEEQRQFNTIAPAVPEHDLLPMLTHYKSYNDYYKIVSNLLLLEMWCSITKEFESVDMNVRRPTLMSSIVENSITWPSAHSPNTYLSSLLLEVLITKEGASKQAYPCYGDLVFFEYTRNNGKKHEFHKVFAYVTNVYQTVLTQHTHFNKELLKHVRNPHILITYTVLTRPLENDICVNRVQRLRTVTYLRATMRLVQGLQYLPQSPLMQCILSPAITLYQLPILHDVQSRPLVTKDKLNVKQLEAVFKVTDTVIQKVPKLCFIQGPPGTGKSTVIVNIVTQILYGDNRYKNHNSSLRILVCAPSNAAIDEIVLRLLNIRASLKEKRFKMVRIGRPETMHPVAKDISVTELAKRDVKKTASSYSSNQIPNDSVEEEKAFLQAKMNALKCEIASSYNVDDAHKKNIKMKLADMNAKYELLKNRKPFGDMNPREFAKLQRAAENKLIEGADIITCTLSSCYNAQMESIFAGSRERISVCIVDEATQSCEAETLIPLMLGVNTLVLVGDTNQLPATVISQRAKQLGLDQSIFARVQNAFDILPHNPIMLLDTQYRMAHAISYWPNKFFYAGKLKNGVQHSTVLPFHQYRILNLNSCQNDNKFKNTDEAEFVANLVLCMLHHPSIESRKIELSMGIVTPYQIQRSLILEKLNERLSSLPEGTRKRAKIHVNTVDAFQGQERDVIIMSCVRSNGIGFLSDRQRLCVALTRAKHCLVLCGNFNTFMRDPMWNALLTDGRGRGVYFNVNARTHPTDMKTFILKP